MQLTDASVDACVSNLPFGQELSVQGEMAAWQRAVLGEIARVTPTGGMRRPVGSANAAQRCIRDAATDRVIPAAGN